MYKVSNGLSPPLISDTFKYKVMILTIYDTILTFPDLLLKLYFKGPKAYLILVQYYGI